MPSAARRPAPRPRPHVEALEARDLPALLFGVTTQNHLISFDSTSPGTLLSDVAITGVGSGEQVLTIDFSPHTNELIALARNGTTFGLYHLDPASGAATPREPNPFPNINLPSGDIGTDFDPVTGHLRLVSSGDDQSRIAVEGIPNPTSSAAINILADVAYVAGDANAGVNPQLVALAHRNNIAGAPVANVFALDAGTDSVVRLGSANGNPDSPDTGKLFTIGAVGVNFTTVAGFDVADGATATAFASLVVGTATRSKLFTLNTSSGAGTEVGNIGTAANVFVRDIAVALVGAVRFDGAAASAAEGAGAVSVPLTRTLPSLVATTVTVAVLAGGSATPGADFTLGTATVTFNPGETSKAVVVNLANDGLIEGAETLRLNLTSATNNASIFNPNLVTLTIVDDDFPPPPPPPAPAGTTFRLLRGKGRTRVQVLDAATGVQRTVLGPFRGRVRARLQEVNGDGVLDLVVNFVRNGRRRRRALDGVSLAPLPAPPG
jgi:hypothetical protein